jgi:hypothetical protein
MEILIAFVANLFAQFVKGYVAKKWGDYGVYAVVFIVALIGTVIYKYVYTIPEWQVIITNALETLAYSVAMYEVILKRIGFADKRTKIAETRG